LHVCDDTGTADHEVLRFDALRALESKSELLQEYGFSAEAQHAASEVCLV
jgi:hypothetical protein